MRWVCYDGKTWGLEGVDINLAYVEVYALSKAIGHDWFAVIINDFGIDNECATLEDAKAFALECLINHAENVIEDAKELLSQSGPRSGVVR